MSDSYVSVSFVADELLTSTKMNQMATNGSNFHNGTALGDGIILTRHLSTLQILTKNLKPTYSYTAGSNGTRQSLSGTGWTAITGASVSYTSGSTNEVLAISGNVLVSATNAGSQCGIIVNGSLVGRTDYADTPFNGVFYGHIAPLTLYEIAANTTVTIAVGVKLAGGTASVANQTSDTTQGYAPSLSIIAFGKS